MPANSVFSGPIAHLLSMLCILMQIFSHASTKRKTERLKGFKCCIFFFLNKWHHDSEVVNSDDTLLAKPPSTAFPAPTFAHQTHELARQIALSDFRVRRAWGLWGCNSTRGGRVGLDGSVQHALHLTQHLSDWPALHDVLNETQTSG